MSKIISGYMTARGNVVIIHHAPDMSKWFNNYKPVAESRQIKGRLATHKERQLAKAGVR